MNTMAPEIKNLDCLSTCKAWLRGQGVFALSLGLHLLVYLGVQGLQGFQFAQDVERTEVTLVDIEGFKNGDGLAAKAPPVKAAKIAKVQPVSSDEIATGVSTTPEVVGTGGTKSSVSGTGQFGVEGGRQAGLEERYSIELRQLFEKYKTYPLIAKKLGHQGKVVVRFSLNDKGEVLKSEVLNPSASEILNKAALELVKKIHGVKPFPEGLQKASWDFEIPVEYKM